MQLFDESDAEYKVIGIVFASAKSDGDIYKIFYLFTAAARSVFIIGFFVV